MDPSWQGYLEYCQQMGFDPGMRHGQSSGSETQAPTQPQMMPDFDINVPETEDQEPAPPNPIATMTLDELLRAPGRNNLKKLIPSKMGGSAW